MLYNSSIKEQLVYRLLILALVTRGTRAIFDSVVQPVWRGDDSSILEISTFNMNELEGNDFMGMIFVDALINPTLIYESNNISNSSNSSSSNDNAANNTSTNPTATCSSQNSSLTLLICPLSFWKREIRLPPTGPGKVCLFNTVAGQYDHLKANCPLIEPMNFDFALTNEQMQSNGRDYAGFQNPDRTVLFNSVNSHRDELHDLSVGDDDANFVYRKFILVTPKSSSSSSSDSSSSDGNSSSDPLPYDGLPISFNYAYSEDSGVLSSFSLEPSKGDAIEFDPTFTNWSSVNGSDGSGINIIPVSMKTRQILIEPEEFYIIAIAHCSISLTGSNPIPTTTATTTKTTDSSCNNTSGIETNCTSSSNSSSSSTAIYAYEDNDYFGISIVVRRFYPAFKYEVDALERALGQYNNNISYSRLLRSDGLCAYDSELRDIYLIAIVAESILLVLALIFTAVYIRAVASNYLKIRPSATLRMNWNPLINIPNPVIFSFSLLFCLIINSAMSFALIDDYVMNSGIILDPSTLNILKNGGSLVNPINPNLTLLILRDSFDWMLSTMIIYVHPTLLFKFVPIYRKWSSLSPTEWRSVLASGMFASWISYIRLSDDFRMSNLCSYIIIHAWLISFNLVHAFRNSLSSLNRQFSRRWRRLLRSEFPHYYQTVYLRSNSNLSIQTPTVGGDENTVQLQKSIAKLKETLESDYHSQIKQYLGILAFFYVFFFALPFVVVIPAFEYTKFQGYHRNNVSEAIKVTYQVVLWITLHLTYLFKYYHF